MRDDPRAVPQFEVVEPVVEGIVDRLTCCPMPVVQLGQYADRDVFLIQKGLPAWDRTLAHELGHLVLGHEGIPVVQAARDNMEMASSDLIGYMLNQRTGCMGPSGEDAEQEAEDFAALLLYRLGRLPSDRASIVQVRLGEAFG